MKCELFFSWFGLDTQILKEEILNVSQFKFSRAILKYLDQSNDKVLQNYLSLSRNSWQKFKFTYSQKFEFLRPTLLFVLGHFFQPWLLDFFRPLVPYNQKEKYC